MNKNITKKLFLLAGIIVISLCLVYTIYNAAFVPLRTKWETKWVTQGEMNAINFLIRNRTFELKRDDDPKQGESTIYTFIVTSRPASKEE